MIPKTIHYCWFGRNPLPNSAVKCINSWRKFFPGYEIKEWNEDNEGCAIAIAQVINNTDLLTIISNYLSTYDYGNGAEVEKIFKLL